MALAAFANIAAAITAGWKELVTDTGVVGGTQFTVLLELPNTGDPDGGSGGMLRATGQGVSQAAAEAVALNAVNAQRLVRYGADTGTVSTGKKAVNAHVRDKT